MRSTARSVASRAAVALLCGATGAACGTLIGIDDLVYDLPTSTGGAAGGSAGGQGGTGGGTGATGGGGTAGSGGASCPSPVAPALQLEGTAQDGQIIVWVDDFFRLVFRQNESWQVGSWNDLATDGLVDLAVAADHSGVLCEPYETLQAGNWWGVEEALSASMTLTDETPTRAIFDTTMAWPPTNSGLEVHAMYTVWASGRVAGAYTLTNTGTIAQSITDVEYNHYTVSRSDSWTGAVLASDHAFTYLRDDGPTPYPGLLVVNHGPETPVRHDHPENIYWRSGAITLDQSDSVLRHGEFQLGPGGQDLETLDNRAADVLDPGLVLVQGATAVGSGFDPAQGAYVVEATAPAVDLRLSAARTRYSPAFVVGSFAYDSWSVSLDGDVLARSGCPSGPRAHAFYDEQADQLVFVYLETIPTSAQDSARTFEIRGQ